MKGDPKIITGQVIYVGPNIVGIGLKFAKLWRDGIDPQLYEWINRCPAIGSLIIPVAQLSGALRQLDFDYAHNMRGTTGAFPVFYQQVRQWLVKTQTPSSTSPLKKGK